MALDLKRGKPDIYDIFRTSWLGKIDKVKLVLIENLLTKVNCCLAAKLILNNYKS